MKRIPGKYKTIYAYAAMKRKRKKLRARIKWIDTKIKQYRETQEAIQLEIELL